jgi:hypothetical protein
MFEKFATVFKAFATEALGVEQRQEKAGKTDWGNRGYSLCN